MAEIMQSILVDAAVRGEMGEGEFAVEKAAAPWIE
jgi:hypothetical protein